VRASYHKAKISEQALRCTFVINLTLAACRISRHESDNSIALRSKVVQFIQTNIRLTPRCPSEAHL